MKFYVNNMIIMHTNGIVEVVVEQLIMERSSLNNRI